MKQSQRVYQALLPELREAHVNSIATVRVALRKRVGLGRNHDARRVAVDGRRVQRC